MPLSVVELEKVEVDQQQNDIVSSVTNRMTKTLKLKGSKEMLQSL